MSPLSNVRLHHEPSGRAAEIISIPNNGDLILVGMAALTPQFLAAKGEVSRREFILMHSED